MHDTAPTLLLGAAPMTIAGSGVAFPTHVVGTHALVDRLADGVPDARRRALADFIDVEVGVHSRAHLDGGVARDLALKAARNALADAGLQTSHVSALVYATSTPSRWTAAESALLARDLGLACAFFDVRSGCTGGLHAIVQAARLARDLDTGAGVNTGGAVLLVAADAFSLTFGAERLLPVSMGDGAAALVFRPRAASDGAGGLRRAAFGGMPTLVDLATVPATLPPHDFRAEDWSLSGDPAAFAEAAEGALMAALDAIAPPHGARVVIHTSRAATARRVALKHGAEPYLRVLREHGNLGAPTLLAALHFLREEGETAPIVLVSAGGGLSYGAALLEGIV